MQFSSSVRFAVGVCLLAVSSLAAAGCASGGDTGGRADTGPRADVGPHDTGTGPSVDGGACRNDAECDDHMACNGMERCTAGSCHPGTAVDCDDGIFCTMDRCDDGNGMCSNAIMDALCATGLICDPLNDCTTPRACTTDTECDDHIFCNGPERCDMAFGCRHGTPPSCDDGHSCTTDACDAGTDACTNTADHAICADGLACNGDERCAPSDPSASSEGCIAGSAPVCDDAVPCTLDVCDEGAHGCTHAPSDALCDDHVFCNGVERCDPSMGRCEGGTPPTCDDTIGCTVGTCDTATDRCTQMANDAACSDGRSCNGAEHCDGTGVTPGNGCVAGAALDCSDGMACTSDSCTEPGMCEHGGSDADADGHTIRGCSGGDDCDDLNPRIFPGVPELCDGIDNDCSGTGVGTSGIDDGPGMQCPFGSAPRACTTACMSAGTQICDGACHLGTCRAAAESCNNCDDDLDGRIDEAGGGSPVLCRAGDVVSCTTSCGTVGTQTCNSGCTFDRCVATEVCNGCDDDGNGMVDNGFSLGGACTAGIGECSRSGTVVCRSDGTGTTCSATAGAPVAELCNARDDNCNGSIDEAFTELGVACMVGTGVCRRSGVFVCRTDGTGTQCSATPGTASAEICNGMDDNCNGTVDDGADGGACDGTDADMCAEGTNRCMGGTLVCDDPNTVNTEVCNMVDDNCDGTVDEGCACTLGMMRSCYGGAAGTQGVGVCHAGMQTCVTGSGGTGSMWGACMGSVVPGAETCNNMDDDCNGTVDNGNPGGGALCDGVDSDMCQEGTMTCTGGALVCGDTTGDSVEVCNGVDDNCAGGIDEGNPGGGAMCDGTDGDSCAEGVLNCTGGSLVCSDTTSTTVEICNGLDDNCAGGVDEGNPGGGAACDGADTDLCTEGTWNCSGGSLVCSDGTSGTAEICGNSVDDDCNPSTSDVCSVPGDTCTSPIVLSGTGGSRSDTLVGATAQTSDCGDGVEVFYSVTVTQPSIVYLSTLGAASFDTRISYRGTTCTATTGVQCVDDSCGVLQTHLAQYVGTGTHFFAVHTFYSGTTPGPYGLTYVVAPAAGGTNTLVSPLPTSGTMQNFSGTTVGAADNSTPNCGSSSAGEASVYWLQCPGEIRSYAASMCGFSTWDSVMNMRFNGAANACNDDFCGFASASAFTGASASGAGLVQLFVDGYGVATGAFTVRVTF